MCCITWIWSYDLDYLPPGQIFFCVFFFVTNLCPGSNFLSLAHKDDVLCNGLCYWTLIQRSNFCCFFFFFSHNLCPDYNFFFVFRCGLMWFMTFNFNLKVKLMLFFFVDQLLSKPLLFCLLMLAFDIWHVDWSPKLNLYTTMYLAWLPWQGSQRWIPSEWFLVYDYD